jgi:hypothetical protein
MVDKAGSGLLGWKFPVIFKKKHSDKSRTYQIKIDLNYQRLKIFNYKDSVHLTHPNLGILSLKFLIN